MNRLHTSIAAAALLAGPGLLGGQQSATHVIHGTLMTVRGPVGGGEVFTLESLDATTTDSLGRFTLRVTAHGTVTIVARHLGLSPASAVVPVDTAGSVDLIMTVQAAPLAPITVQAGGYTAGNERGATLSALQVVTTPGATGDVARAIQSLPGVQSVDEGTGLFVRGGDVSETKILLNDAVMLAPYNYETPTGNFTTTVNPFLLDGIFFSSGGFGARYGNILSGVADLRTQGRPVQTSATLAVGLASISGGANVALDHGLTVDATAARNNTDLLFRLSGATRDYAPPPNGDDYSASVIWDYRPTGEIKSFAIDRRSTVGIGVNDPSFDGGYYDAEHSTMVQTGWKDLFGNVAPTMSLSYQDRNSNNLYGPFGLSDREGWWQLFAQAAWSLSDRYTLRAGGDADDRGAHFVGVLPDSTVGIPLDGTFTKFDSRADGTRTGLFAEADWRALDALRVIGGIRTDRSTYTGVRTTDPRLSAAYKLGPATLTAATGIYHQVSDPLYFAAGLGAPGIGPMQARQFVAGAQLGETGDVARLEIYDKRYSDLVGLTRDKTVVGGGTGDAHGADLFLKRRLSAAFSARATYSYVDSRRTDPNTGIVAAAPFDITNSLTLIADWEMPAGWELSGAWRSATGKPFTPVTGATFDPATNTWTAQYGAPDSQRLPPFRRVDLSLSRATRAFGAMLVYYCSVQNLTNRDNIYEYVYSADFSKRIAVRSLFNRSVYFGGSITHLGT